MMDPDGSGFAEFDHFFEERGYKDGQEPEAFADWLSSKTGKPVVGVAMDLSGTVYGESFDVAD